MDRGIVLAGGGALLHGLDERLRHETQMPVHLAESPLTCVAVGSGRSLEEFEAIHRSRSRARPQPRTATGGIRTPRLPDAGSSAEASPAATLERSSCPRNRTATTRRCWACPVRRPAAPRPFTSSLRAQRPPAADRRGARWSLLSLALITVSFRESDERAAARAPRTPRRARSGRSRSPPSASRARSGTPRLDDRPLRRPLGGRAPARARTRCCAQQVIQNAVGAAGERRPEGAARLRRGPAVPERLPGRRDRASPRSPAGAFEQQIVLAASARTTASSSTRRS